MVGMAHRLASSICHLPFVICHCTELKARCRRAASDNPDNDGTVFRCPQSPGYGGSSQQQMITGPQTKLDRNWLTCAQATDASTLISSVFPSGPSARCQCSSLNIKEIRPANFNLFTIDADWAFDCGLATPCLPCHFGEAHEFFQQGR
jgi:hypothetical protein